MVRQSGWLLAVALAVCSAGTVRAEPATDRIAPRPPGRGAAEVTNVVALLPLDADAKLEIYGQPVASELARALVAGSIDVVVVGPKMTVPERARLIVDGRIAGAKGSDGVTLTIRVRNASDGIVLETLDATAPGLANIDRAAAELSARVLPVVRAKLSANEARTTDASPRRTLPPRHDPRKDMLAPARTGFDVPPSWPVVIAGDPLLAGALRDAVPGWSRGVPGTQIAFEVRGYRVDAGPVPLARAAVRVHVQLGAETVFDRTVITDTVVGDRAMAADAMAARVAREVLAIVRPHLRRR